MFHVHVRALLARLAGELEKRGGAAYAHPQTSGRMPLVCQLSPSCALVRLRGHHVLLLRGDPQGLPVSSEALGTVDTVLVSSASAMLMLPSLTQAAGFRGQVVATAAALRLGEQLLLERVALHAAAREHSLEMAAPAPDQQSSAADVAACVGRVQSVSFGERVELSCSVHAAALPAGCGIGAAVWSVQAAGPDLTLTLTLTPPLTRSRPNPNPNPDTNPYQASASCSPARAHRHRSSSTAEVAAPSCQRARTSCQGRRARRRTPRRGWL